MNRYEFIIIVIATICLSIIIGLVVSDRNARTNHEQHVYNEIPLKTFTSYDDVHWGFKDDK